MLASTVKFSTYNLQPTPKTTNVIPSVRPTTRRNQPAHQHTPKKPSSSPRTHCLCRPILQDPTTCHGHPPRPPPRSTATSRGRRPVLARDDQRRCPTIDVPPVSTRCPTLGDRPGSATTSTRPAADNAP